MEVTINNTQVEIKKTLRSLMIYEQIENSGFEGGTLTSLITYFYAIILANYKKNDFGFDDFISWLDDNEDKFTEFCEWFAKTNKVENNLTNIESEPTTKKKQ